jgi:hypothetical protein
MRTAAGRPTIPVEIRKLMPEMSGANVLWEAPRIQANCSARDRCRPERSCKIHGDEKAPPLQEWKTFSQPCRRHGVDRHVRHPNDLVPAVVWTSGPAAFAYAVSEGGEALLWIHGHLRSSITIAVRRRQSKPSGELSLTVGLRFVIDLCGVRTAAL